MSGFARLSKNYYLRNIMGLTPEDLEVHCKVDPWYEKVTIGGTTLLEAESAGKLFTLESPVEFDIEKGSAVHIEINPAVHEFGVACYEQIIGSGRVRPMFVIRAHRKGEVELSYLFRARLYG